MYFKVLQEHSAKNSRALLVILISDLALLDMNMSLSTFTCPY